MKPLVLAALALVTGSILACTGASNPSGSSGSGGAAAATSAGTGTTSSSQGGASSTATSSSSQGGSSSAMSSTTTTTASSGQGGGLPAFASFHLNYTQTKDWARCADRDFVIFDLFDTPAGDFAQCKAMGAKMLCYFSSQYEDWRDDAGQFGMLGGPLGGWPGEQWVDPNDPQNLEVMKGRLDIAVSKGCDGVDVDNVDHAGHESYVMAIYQEARNRGLLVSQKNAIDQIMQFWSLVDLYQNEQCQEYNECAAYDGLGRPVYNIEYTPCQTFPYLYSHRKDMDTMDAWEEACAP